MNDDDQPVTVRAAKPEPGFAIPPEPKLYIVGALAANAYPQALKITECAPVPNGNADHVGFPVAMKDGKRFGGMVGSLGFGVARGRVKEWSSPNTGQRIIAREVNEPTLIAQVEAAEKAMTDAEEALRVARTELQDTLAAVAARCQPAKVRP